MKNAFRALGILLAVTCLATLGCSSSTAEGPELALQEFYRHLNGGDYAGAMALYNEAALEVLEDPSISSDAGFEQWAELETKKGKVDEVRVLDSQVTDNAADLEYEVVYTDGSKKTGRVSLTLEGGQWKLGFVG